MPLNAVALILLFKDKIFPLFSFTTPTLTAKLPAITTHILQDGKSFFTPHLDELFNLWNNTVCKMNYWVCMAGRYRPTSIPEEVHKAFFNYYQFHVMANMPDEIVIARMMTTLDMEFVRTLHYHDKGYESGNDYGLPPCTTRLVWIYSVFSAEASFNLANYTTTQCQLSSFTLRCPRGLPFWERVCQCLNLWWNTLPMLAADLRMKKKTYQWQNSMTPCGTSSQYQTVGNTSASMRFLGQPPYSTPPTCTKWPHPCSSTKDFQTHHPSNLIRCKCPHNWNWWIWMHWMISQTW